jgi:hypothetical protein
MDKTEKTFDEIMDSRSQEEILEEQIKKLKEDQNLIQEKIKELAENFDALKCNYIGMGSYYGGWKIVKDLIFNIEKIFIKNK